MDSSSIFPKPINHRRRLYYHPDLQRFWEIKLNNISYETVTRTGWLTYNGEEDFRSTVLQNLSHDSFRDALTYYEDCWRKIETEGYLLNKLEQGKEDNSQSCMEEEFAKSSSLIMSDISKSLNKKGTKRSHKMELDEDHLKMVKKDQVFSC